MTVAAVEGHATSTALVLPHDEASVGRARSRLTEDLQAAGVAPVDIDNARLVLSELLSNALRHARPLPGGTVRVAWVRRAYELEIAVTDGGGSTAPRMLELPVAAVSGRGMAIVAALAERWGVRKEPGQATVYAVLSAKQAAMTGASRSTPGMVHALGHDGGMPSRGNGPAASSDRPPGEVEANPPDRHFLYDGDCGFCTTTAHLLQRWTGTSAAVVPWQFSDLDALGTTREQAEHEVVWVGRDGRVFGGAQAVAALLVDSGGWWRGLGWLVRTPPISWLAHLVYRLVAENRYRLPGGTPACALPRRETTERDAP
ncbi:MAG TPA: DCC1-like thiol-disulfide oxidoreductase family protein [Actinopolymorphaceae bacterium]